MKKLYKPISFLSIFLIIISCFIFSSCIGERKYEMYKAQRLRNGVVIEEYTDGNYPEGFEDFEITNLVFQINYKVRVDGVDHDEISWRETDTEMRIYNNYGQMLVLRKEGNFLIMEQEIDGDLFQLYYKRV